MVSRINQVYDDFYKSNISNIDFYYQIQNMENAGFFSGVSAIIGIDVTSRNDSLALSSFLGNHSNYTAASLPAVQAINVTYPVSTRNVILNFVAGYKMDRKVKSELARLVPNHSLKNITMISSNSRFVDDVNLVADLLVPFGTNASAYENL